MKKMGKKGFTIVELVIVIAVIAILASVLIPTFSGVVSKANQSAALQEATSTMKSTLAMSDYGTIAEGTYFVVDGMGSNGYQFIYENNSIKAVDTAVDTIAYNAPTSGTADKTWKNAFIVNKDLISSNNWVATKADTVKAIVKAAIGDGSLAAAPSGSLYSYTYTVGGADTYTKDATPTYAPSKYVKDGDSYRAWTNEDSGDTYTKATGSSTVWNVYTNSDYATDVVTFTYSK